MGFQDITGRPRLRVTSRPPSPKASFYVGGSGGLEGRPCASPLLRARLSEAESGVLVYVAWAGGTVTVTR